jgi:hypothetical protein
MLTHPSIDKSHDWTRSQGLALTLQAPTLLLTMLLCMQSVMMNPKLQQRMQELRNDPDMADFWKEIQTGGMQVWGPGQTMVRDSAHHILSWHWSVRSPNSAYTGLLCRR